MTADTVEQTLVLIKPDAIKLSLTGYLLSQLSEAHTGLLKAGLRIVQVSRMLAEEHYAEHRGKPFFGSLIDYITGRAHYPTEPGQRRVVSIVYSGAGAVKKMRQIAGPTNPHEARESAPGTVRALGTIVEVKDAAGNPVSQRMDNLIHASANPEDAEREIKLWFEPRNIISAMRGYPVKVCEGHYYYKEGRLLTRNELGSVCLLAAGELAWASDLEALERLVEGAPAALSLDAVAAKYLSNRETELP